MLKIGILGAGHLGKIHLKLADKSEKYQSLGFYDTDATQAKRVVNELGYPYFSCISELINTVDVLDIVTPTPSHYEYAKQAIISGKHVFIEKPITATVEQAEELIRLSKKYKVKGQVGHVERFNPAFTAVREQLNSPMFIEAHRLAEFNPRGTDVPVVLDLMIHDIDIILSIVKSKVKRINASGVSVISKSPDIANARIEFENGCVANLTSSRISLKNMRKSRFFQKDAYISIDYLEKKVEVVRMKNAPNEVSDFAFILENADGEKKQIYFENPEISTNNAILDELETFAQAIENDTDPIVKLNDGMKALSIAKRIIECF